MPLLQLGDEVEDARLDGHVERRRRLVGDQEVGVAGERLGDHHPLLHAAGELVRIALHHLCGGWGSASRRAPSATSRRRTACEPVRRDRSGGSASSRRSRPTSSAGAARAAAARAPACSGVHAGGAQDLVAIGAGGTPRRPGARIGHAPGSAPCRGPGRSWRCDCRGSRASARPRRRAGRRSPARRRRSRRSRPGAGRAGQGAPAAAVAARAAARPAQIGHRAGGRNSDPSRRPRRPGGSGTSRSNDRAVTLLPRAGLADEAERLAVADVEADAVHRVDDAALGAEVHLQVRRTSEAIDAAGARRRAASGGPVSISGLPCADRARRAGRRRPG